MKKTTMVLIALIIFCFCGCAENNIADDTQQEIPVFSEVIEEQPEEKPAAAPEVTLVINDSETDSENDLIIFEDCYTRGDYAYIHYYLDGEDQKSDIRIKIETLWGSEDDEISEEYEVESDEIVTKTAGEWHTEKISVSASNILFYRVTMYHGETKEILASKTIYTPYEKAVFSEVPAEIPEFRPITLLDEEQEFYDLCSPAVLEYGKKHGHSGIDTLVGWWSTDGTELYLIVYYAGPYEAVWFKIDLSDVSRYSTSDTTYGFIKEGEGKPEQCVLDEYYYVAKEIRRGLKG